MENKMRLDSLLTQQHPDKSRSFLQHLIHKGEVWVNGKAVTKPGQLVNATDQIEISTLQMKYVSRGGFKLEKALETFKIDCHGLQVLDIGASTGGFTDCALQHGATLVYAVDVGQNQLAASLQDNPKVISKEKLNFRYATPEQLDNQRFELITIDVSFISLKPIFANLPNFCHPDTKVIALIKPQFEAGLDYVGNKGLVRSHAGHQAAIENAISDAKAAGFQLVALIKSPLHGGKSGNLEYLGFFMLENAAKNVKIEPVEIMEDESHD